MCCYVSKLKLPVVFQKRNWNFAFAFEHLWLELELLNLLFPLKLHSRNSWETAHLSKMLCDNDPLTVQKFGQNIMPSKFPAALSFLNLLEAPSLFGEHFFFFYDFKNIENLITLVNSNAASRQPLIIFVALMVSLST